MAKTSGKMMREMTSIRLERSVYVPSQVRQHVSVWPSTPIRGRWLWFSSMKMTSVLDGTSGFYTRKKGNASLTAGFLSRRVDWTSAPRRPIHKETNMDGTYTTSLSCARVDVEENAALKTPHGYGCRYLSGHNCQTVPEGSALCQKRFDSGENHVE